MTEDKNKKIEIPQFVADWIEKCKALGIPIIEAMTSEDIPKEISDYLWCVNDETECSEIFARAWLDGYRVIEKKYKVQLNNNQMLVQVLNDVFFTSPFSFEKNVFTQTELEKLGFGWVLDCDGVKLTEVEV